LETIKVLKKMTTLVKISTKKDFLNLKKKFWSDKKMTLVKRIPF